MTDKVKVSKWFDKWIKNNKKDKSKGVLLTFIYPCAYHDKYFEYRMNNHQFTEKQYLEIKENFEDYVRAILDDDYEVEEEKTPKEDSIQETLQKVEDARHKESHEFLQSKKTGSMVNHPKHYQGNKFEVIDIIEDFDLNFSLGSAIKYILRAGKKGNRYQDLEKAIWYLQREIENE